MKFDHRYSRLPLHSGHHTMEERHAEVRRAMRSMVLDLFDADLAAVKIVWWITKDPDSYYNAQTLMLDATVTDLFTESA